MPSTHLSLHYHIIFSTKNRQPLIVDNWRNRLHAYLGGAIDGLGATPVAIGGTADHLHLLIGSGATIQLSELVRQIKHSSSYWAHKSVGLSEFNWQAGYGAFTVSPSQVAVVKGYLAKQQQHHQRNTFQQEYLEFLDKSGIEYDRRYLW